MLSLLLTTVLASYSPVEAPSLQVAPLSSPSAFSDDEKMGDKKKDDAKEEPKLDPEKVKATVDHLKGVFRKSKDTVDKLEAIKIALEFPHKDVANALARGLKDDDHEVVLSTIGALTQLKHPEALKQLVSGHKREKVIQKDHELLGYILKGIGSYGDPDNVDLLSKNIFKDDGKEARRARIYGLGNTRCNESVEALIKIIGSAKKKKIQPFMGDINLALSVLTGSDQGKSQDRWVKWWNDNKRTLEVAEEVPELPNAVQKAWDKYWGIYNADERKKKREDRGDGKGGA